MSPRMPVLFLAHGAPPLLDDAEWMAEFGAWAAALPKPKAILMISAHWEERPVTIGATTTVPLVYDFYGFPERYYQVKYASPGAAELAGRVRELLAAASIAVADDPSRGLDHGSFIPLIGMYPKADIPVLQISMPSLEAKELFAIGRALAPLRDEGVIVMGSGFLTHNLRMFGRAGGAAPAAWAKEFDDWAGKTLAARDFDQLLDYRRRAPAVDLAHPRVEHFVPVIISAGAASTTPDAVSFPISGFVWGPFTKRSVQFG